MSRAKGRPVELNLLAEAQDDIRHFLAAPKAAGTAEAVKAAFGKDVSAAQVSAVVQGFERSGWPKLVLADADDLHGARAAYDPAKQTIYLSRDYLANARPEAVKAALIEELGHAIDARVHRADAAGDEGEIFARFVTGHAPDATELAALHAQNDHGTIQVAGKIVSVELAAPVVGTVTLDGDLADWSAAQRIDKSLGQPGYEVYGKASGDSFVFALKAPTAIGANTTAWLNTDQNAATGFQVFGFAGGAEYNVNFDASGTPQLYTGGAGQTAVAGATVSFGKSADGTIVEFAVQKSAIGTTGGAINTLWDVNDVSFLPTSYSATQYEVLDTSGLPERTDFSKKVGIVFSETSAKAYFSEMAYSQLFMDAQHQASMAGVSYDVLSEADLTDISKLANYDALVFPGFRNVAADKVAAIESTLKLAVQHYHIGIVTAGEFMTNDGSGAALAGDPYARMKSLLDLNIVGSGFPADVSIKASTGTHPVMDGYAAGESIHDYHGVGWLAFAPGTSAGASVLATQTIGTQTFDAVIATTTGGRNVHFSTDGVMADNNMLWQAIDYAVNGGGITAGLQMSRQSSIVASRNDMDQAMETEDVRPESGGPGIYDALVPILSDWKSDFNFVGSYYIDIGNRPAQGQSTDWAYSGNYYRQMVAMGNEIGSHSVSHPEDTNVLSAAQIQSEFLGSKQIIEREMSALLGRPYAVDGAAVPGAPENLATALSIIQYYDYLSGGYSGVGAGYPGAFGYLNPAMAAQDKVYLAPNVTFDFTNVEFKGMTPAQAAAQWQAEWNALTAHSDVPVVLWPWHDYGAAMWSTNPPAGSPYTTAMFTDFIARAHAAGAEFVTLGDLADRISAFEDAAVSTSISGNTVHAVVNSADAGRFALDLDGLGTQKIASVANWYAYDDDSVFLPRAGGTYDITLGAAANDVTHITALPMRAELISLGGNGTDLDFSLIGEGKVTIDLTDPAGRSAVVTGATISSLTGDKLVLDLGAIGQHDVTVRLVTANHAPVIASNGGGDTAAVSVSENSTAVTTVAATDADAGQTLAYSIAGGADAARFAIDARTGALTFATAPDYEAGARSFVVQVAATDNGAPNMRDLQTINVTVLDANDNAPVITTAAAQTVAENTTQVAALGSTDADTVGGPAAWSITGGADAAKFGIVGGNLVFLAAPDFENAGDADGNNSYLVQVSASDGQNVSNRLITANVTNVAENGAPVITSNGGGASAAISVAENSTAVTTVRATDPDGQALAYSITGGADAASFGINAQTGVLAFRAAPDFERPADQGGNNVYDVIVAARDTAGTADTQALAVRVTNVGGTSQTARGLISLLNGGGEEDTLTGGGGADFLYGNGGNDRLSGGNAMDFLTGGAGNDTLTGGRGSDFFDFNSLTEGLDLITDFETGRRGDDIDLRGLLTGFRAASIDSFIRVSGTSSSTFSFNADGVGTDFVDLFTLQGVANNGHLAADLFAQGNLLI